MQVAEEQGGQSIERISLLSAIVPLLVGLAMAMCGGVLIHAVELMYIMEKVRVGLIVGFQPSPIDYASHCTAGVVLWLIICDLQAVFLWARRNTRDSSLLQTLWMHPFVVAFAVVGWLGLTIMGYVVGLDDHDYEFQWLIVSWLAVSLVSVYWLMQCGVSRNIEQDSNRPYEPQVTKGKTNNE